NDTSGSPSHFWEFHLDRIRARRPVRDRAVAGQAGPRAGILPVGRLVLLYLRFRSIAAHAYNRLSVPASDPLRAAAGLSNADAGRAVVALRSGRIGLWPVAGPRLVVHLPARLRNKRPDHKRAQFFTDLPYRHGAGRDGLRDAVSHTAYSLRAPGHAS